MSKKVSVIFPFGGSYVPVAKSTEVSMDKWDEDIGNMRKLGFSLFRAFVAWDRIEKIEGARDYSMLDYAFELAEKHGVKVMLNLGGVFCNLVSIYPPWWLVHKYDCQRLMPEPYDRARPFGPRQEICMDDPVMREKGEGFLRETIKRYAASDTLHSWVVWNEPMLRRPCYCPHTQARFRDWLKKKYAGNIETLNAQWSTEFPVLYEDWSQIEPPAGTGFRQGGISTWLDWQYFQQDNLAGALGWINSLVKEYDQRPTTSNVMRFDLGDEAYETHTDIHKIGRNLDVLGYSQYTIYGDCALPHVMSARLDRLRSASACRDFYVIEAEAGRVSFGSAPSDNTEASPGPVCTSDADRILRNWQAVGHGAKCWLGWKYRTRVADTQSGCYNMVAFDGSLPKRVKALGEMSTVLQKHAALFNERHVPQPEVAILAANSTCVWGKVEGHLFSDKKEDSYWRRGWMGAHRLLREAGIGSDFLDDLDVRENALDKYKVLLIPFRPNLEQDIADRIAAFVKRGGVAIAESIFGYKSDFGRLYYHAPGCGLEKVFGYTTADPLAPDDASMKFSQKHGGGEIKNFIFQEVLAPLPDAEIAARYPSGGAAAVANTYGKGRTLMAGTFLFSQYEISRNEAVRNLILSELKKAGVTPGYEISVKEKTFDMRDIEVCRLAKDGEAGGSIWVILNHTDKKARVSLSLPESGVKGYAELQTGKTIAAKGAKKLSKIELSLPGKGVAVLLAKGTEGLRD
jgi:beta-galactosidase GanA